MKSTRRGSFSVHRSAKTPGFKYSSPRGLSPRGHLERQAEAHASTPDKAGPHQGVQAHLRQAQPPMELRIPVDLSRDELEAVDRGADDPDLDPVREAARAIALAEDKAVFHGFRDAGIGGIVAAASASKCTLSEDYAGYLGVVAEALYKLRSGGIDGPYAI